MGEFDVDFSDRGILDGHKSLRERAIEAERLQREAEAAARDEQADELRQVAYEFMVDLLQIDPRDADCVEFNRLANTSEGKAVIGFTFDKLTFKVRIVKEKVDDEYEEVPILEVRCTMSSYKRIKSLADLGRAIS